jgi:hypothetical protein
MAATTLLAAGLAVSTFTFVVEFFLIGVGATTFFLTIDFFSIATVVSPQFDFGFAPYTSNDWQLIANLESRLVKS